MLATVVFISIFLLTRSATVLPWSTRAPSCLDSSKMIPGMEGNISPGEKMVSPNGQYWVQEVTEGGKWSGTFAVSGKDETGNNQLKLADLKNVGAENPLKGICWSSDSRQIAVMYHSGGLRGASPTSNTYIYILQVTSKSTALTAEPVIIRQLPSIELSGENKYYHHVQFTDRDLAIHIWDENLKGEDKYIALKEALPGPTLTTTR